MVFSSLVFLFLFLPIVFIAYYIVPAKYRMVRNLLLLIVSLFFYAWGEPVYVYLMVFEIISNYLLVLLMDKLPKMKKGIFILIVLIDLLALGIYKYADFVIDNINRLFHLNMNYLYLALPIGISFYTFQILSYVIDVYRGKVKVQKNLVNLAMYVCLFPQLIAGPIVRYIDIEEQVSNRTENIEDIANGLRRFIIGLGKKVLLANNLALIADILFVNENGYELNGLIAVLGSVAYTLQIYYDFSGYSDMAIGLGAVFGFKFNENFNYPYIANSVTDFWRRWHISLSGWFRDYVYIPLGGNRVSKTNWLRNILVVWMLTGLWHGASWNFVIWGLYYGIILVVEKLVTGKYLSKLKGLNVLITFMIVNFGWIIFNANSFESIQRIMSLFFTNYSFNYDKFAQMDIIQSWPYFIFGLIGATPLIKKIYQKMNENWISGLAFDLLLAVIFGFSVITLVVSSYNPFIYFRF